MKDNDRVRELTLGEFITAAYDLYGKGKARGLVRLAIQTRMVQLPQKDRRNARRKSGLTVKTKL